MSAAVRKRSGGSIKPTLGTEIHRLAKFRAASMGVPLSAFIRNAVKKYMQTHAGFNGEPVTPGVNDDLVAKGYAAPVKTVPEVYTGMTSEDPRP